MVCRSLHLFFVYFQELDQLPDLPTAIEESVTEDLLAEENYLNLSLRSCDVLECVSTKFHDYCGQDICSVETKRLPKSSQTDTIIRNGHSNSQTQTDTTVETHIPIMRSVGTQTDFAEQKNTGTQVRLPDLTIEDIDSQEMCMFYTGIPSKEEFYLLFNELDDASQNTHRAGDGTKKGRPRSLRLIDEFFMVLLRLRLGLLLEDLSFRFKVSKATCSNIVNEWISYLSIKFRSLTPWPSRTKVQATMPGKFKKRYPNCRVIIDCTEFYTQNPQSLANKTLMYSHYKSHMTWKALLGISPAGVITFVSDMWTGSISDKQLTLRCGILDLCEPGDAIMADKGFQISDLTAPRGLHLIVPPMKFEKFNRRQVEETRRIANLRIDVERAMERVKNFRILQGVMPINMSHQGSDILKICVGLSNLLPPLVHDSDV